MEGIIVGIIVGLTGLWAGSRLFGRRKASACSLGCAACTCELKPRPLAQPKR